MIAGKRPLTDRQRQIFDAIVAYIDEHGFAPTLRELGPIVGIGSANGVSFNLRTLVKKGFIAIDPGVARGIRVVDLDTPRLTVAFPLPDGVTLTGRQAEVLDFIAETYAAKERAPSILQICRRFGWSSPNAAYRHISKLKAKGVLESEFGKPRSIRPAGKAVGA